MKMIVEDHSMSNDDKELKKNVGLYVCPKCGKKIPNSIGLINRHVCSDVTIKATQSDVENDLKNIENESRETFIEVIEKSIKSGMDEISLDVNGIIIEGKVIKIDRENSRLTIKDSFNQYHVLTFECVKKSFSLA